MTVVGLVSVKHGPGATTAAVALAAAAGEDALVIELDPEGGDIAARAHLALEPGLMTLAAAGRHLATSLDVTSHLQHLPSGVAALVAPTSPEQSATAGAAVASRLPDAIRQMQRDGYIDCGRWSQTSTANAALASCDAVLVVTEPTVGGVEHVRTRLDAISSACKTVGVILVGDRPYSSADVASALGARVVGALAIDPRGVVAVHQGPRSAARRSMLVRSARTAIDALRAQQPEDVGASR